MHQLRRGGVEKLLLGLFSEHFCINATFLKGVILVSEMISSSVLTFFWCAHICMYALADLIFYGILKGSLIFVVAFFMAFFGNQQKSFLEPFKHKGQHFYDPLFPCSSPHFCMEVRGKQMVMDKAIKKLGKIRQFFPL